MNDTPAERDSTWTRLRRRKVVQWGLVYVAAAWGFLQGLEYVSDAFQWPPQIRQIALLVLLIGLPVVLVLAWYHGDRGQQRISTPEFAILTLLLLLGGGAFWYYQRTSEAGRDAAPAATTAKPDTPPEPRDARPSIAVLPFENRSRVEDDAFFVDGIHDDILTQLSKVSALRVISRTSVEQFRDTKLSMKAIADQLGVTRILEGGVQRAGDRVRVTVQLIDAATDAHLWAENYDRELSAANIFVIQSEVAAAIAGALKAALTPAEQERVKWVPTQSLQAWEAYQLGKQRMGNRTGKGLREAEHFFREATNVDPKFALAWVGLADTRTLQAMYSFGPRKPALVEAEQAVARALDFDPNLAEAWASAGLIALNRQQISRAEELLRRAIALNPNYALAQHWLSNALFELGRRPEALTAAEHAVALDPLSTIINIHLGITRMGVGRFDEALSAFRHTSAIDPSMTWPYSNAGDLYSTVFDRYDLAVPLYEKARALDTENPDFCAALAQTHWELGNDQEAARWLALTVASEETPALSNFVAAIMYLDRGDDAASLRYARQAAELDSVYLFLLRDHDLRRGDSVTARERYAKVFPRLFTGSLSNLDLREIFAAAELALVLQRTGETKQAQLLLDRSEQTVQGIPRVGVYGFRLMDVAIAAMRGDKDAALARLREAEKANLRDRWRYFRDFDPALDSIRNEPAFKAVFSDIERDMAKQRAALAARPKDAPLELTGAR